MQTRKEIAALVDAINEEAFGAGIHLKDGEFVELEALLHAHPELWPIGIADTFKLLQQKLRWESIDRMAIPEPLLDFFDQKFKRDLDPMAMARQIGHEIGVACEECSCRC